MKAAFKKYRIQALGVLIGLINGLFGAGGGTVAIALLKSEKLEQHKAHATSISIILPLSFISALVYFVNGKLGSFSWLVALGALPGGLIGAKLMGRLSEVWLSRVFSGFMLISAIRLFFSA